MQDVYDFIALKSVESAQKITDKLFKKPNVLLQTGFENTGQIDEINPKYRHLIEGNYKILYSVSENAIFINRVFDCRKDPNKLKKY